jgi:MFS family permease
LDPVVTGSLVIVAVAALILGYLGMRYPRGRKDWPHERERTFRYIISGILFFIIMGLIYWITRYWDYPLSGEGVFYLALIIIPILLILGLVFPKGKQGLLE